MSDSKEQEELSMEEILASIRKIISEKEEEPLADEDESVAEDDAEVKKKAHLGPRNQFGPGSAEPPPKTCLRKRQRSLPKRKGAQKKRFSS